MSAKVFISYRREDAAPYAGRLYDRLTAHFGEDQVFIDIDKIPPGEDFVEAINRTVSTCDVAIVVIGPRWLGATDASGKRRLDDKEDFLRMEIVAALQRNIRVIPVLVGGEQMPRKQDLPEALASLSRRNAIELSEIRFRDDVNRLIKAIKKPTQTTRLGRLFLWLHRSLRSLLSSPKLRVPLKRRMIVVTAVGATVILLLTIIWLLTRCHPENDYAEALKLAAGLGGTRIDLPKAAKYLQCAAAKNLPEAEGRLAHWVNNGTGGLAKDHGKAAQLANRAFAHGLGTKETNEAKFEEAALYEDGLGVSQDFGAAKDLYQEAANQGYAAAQVNLGQLYEHGTLAPPGTLVLRNPEKEQEKAAELYQKAADQGYAAAQNNLGQLYQNGKGVTKDLGKAVELYQKAAYQGHAAAQNNLGSLYYRGEGVSKDFGKAADLYQKAANQGYAPAENNLGWLYEHGQGVPKDLGRAVELYQKAAKHDDENAPANLKRLSGH